VHSEQRFTEDQDEQPHLDEALAVSEDQDKKKSGAVQQDKFIGKTIADRYEILDLAGKGGMSVVYRAKHLLTQKIVALKLMHPHLLADDNAVRRFQQEAKAASRLHHPNAISVEDMGVTEDGQPFLTMDYLDGLPLSDVIKTWGKMDPERCIHIFVQVCAALAHAHEQRIVHRDLKPSNVMLVRSDENPDFVKVVDFGIAKILPEGGEVLKLTATGDVFGSPLYMSPEQCMGHQLDARSDIYSMGCLMYEALTGKAPHEGNNALETMYKHTNLAAPSLAEIDADPRLIQRLDHILQKCMAKVPEQRYQSMLELKDDLLDASGSTQKGSKIAAKLGMGAVDKGRKFDNRLSKVSSKKLFWFVAVPLLLVLGVGASSFGYYWISTAGDPTLTDRELVLNRYISRVKADSDISESMEKECKTAPAVLQKSIDTLSDAEQNHESNLSLFLTMKRASHTYTPQEYYYRSQRYGVYFTKNGDYTEALDAFSTAMGVSKQNGFSNPLDNALMQALVAECLMMAAGESSTETRLGDSTSSTVKDPLGWALLAYRGFKEGNVDSTSYVTANLGNLLELYSTRPEKLRDGIPYLEELFKNRENAPLVEGLAFAQAAQFAEACAANGITAIPIWERDPQKNMDTKIPISTTELAARALRKSLAEWSQLERKRSKRAVFYNEGVILNRLGLLAEQNGDLTLAERQFNDALEKLAQANNNKDESVAKVLFNLSEVQLKEHKLADYYKNHSDAKRIWVDTFHPRKKTSSA
jgi:serine/threonine protein kinase